MNISLLDALIFINQVIYCYAIIFLVQKNYRLKTARSLSDGLVLGLLNAFIAAIFYIFCLGLPVAYRISIAFQTILICIIIAQRFWYDSLSCKPLLDCFYVANILTAIAIVPVAFIWPHQVGNIAGWLGLVLIVANRVPQMIKIEREKSVYGFSYQFTLLLGIATTMEMGIVLWYHHLPVQTLLIGTWALLSFFIFTWQFYRFSWRKPNSPC